MDPNSGKIYRTENDDEARERGLIPISEDEVKLLRKLPQHERTRELLTLRALHPLAQLPGMTVDDMRRLRNALKRQRRERTSG